MTDISVSVIVATYNSEKTIKKCLESICNSDYSVLEIVVIDDGSTDETPALIEECKKRYDCIKYFRIDNSGPGKARNEGLRHITGDYFIFADSDDFLEPDAVSKLVQIAKEKEADIVCGTYNRIDKDKHTKISLPVSEGYVTKYGTCEEQGRYHKIKTCNAFGYLWNKLHKTSFFKEREIFLPEEKELNLEDNLFYMMALAMEPKFYISDVIVTNYNAKDASLTRRFDKEYWRKSMESISYGYQALMKAECLQENLDIFLPMAMRLYCFSLVRNSAYQKVTITQLKEMTKCFLEQKAFYHIIHTKESHKAIKTIQSTPQRWALGYAMKSLQKGKYATFLSIIRIACPMIRIYLKKVLK